LEKCLSRPEFVEFVCDSILVSVAGVTGAYYLSQGYREKGIDISPPFRVPEDLEDKYVHRRKDKNTMSERMKKLVSICSIIRCTVLKGFPTSRPGFMMVVTL